MQIDELAGNTVKITLNPSDMDGYRIKCEDISGDSRTSELALSRLISCLSEDHNLGLCGERLLVEAFPKSDGGCTLYISCLKGAPSGKNTSCRPPLTAVICEGELCVLARLCKALRAVAGHSSAAEQIVRKPHRHYTAHRVGVPPSVIYGSQPYERHGGILHSAYRQGN